MLASVLLLAVFLFGGFGKAPQPQHLRHIHPAEFGLPVVERCRADAMETAHLPSLSAGFLLLQHRNNLLLDKSLLHRLLLAQVLGHAQWQTLLKTGGIEGEKVRR